MLYSEEKRKTQLEMDIENYLDKLYTTGTPEELHNAIKIFTEYEFLSYINTCCNETDTDIRQALYYESDVTLADHKILKKLTPEQVREKITICSKAIQEVKETYNKRLVELRDIIVEMVKQNNGK